MTVTAQIGTLFESLLVEAPHDLIGQMGWRLIDPSDGSIVIARKTSGITEPSIGTYYTTAYAPERADQFLIIWDYHGTEATEALVTQVAPLIGPTYATMVDLRNYSPLTEGYTDGQLDQILRDAERWIDSYLLPMHVNADTGLKYYPPTMVTEDAVQLNHATCAQAEYMLHMGPGFFISGSTNIVGGDYNENRAPKIAPKAKQHLINGGFIRLTARAV
jgi:hypothetical protein